MAWNAAVLKAADNTLNVLKAGFPIWRRFPAQENAAGRERGTTWHYLLAFIHDFAYRKLRFNSKGA